MRNHILVLLASTALVAASAPALAQSASSQGNNPSMQQNAQPGSAPRRAQTQSQQPVGQVDDRSFVREAAIGNEFEIRSSELALDTTSDADVEEFAERMIDDHEQAGQALESAAGDLNVPGDLDGRQARRMDRLQQLSGDRFDRRYVNLQVRAHRNMVSLFERFVQGDESNAAMSGGSNDSNGMIRSRGRAGEAAAGNEAGSRNDRSRSTDAADDAGAGHDRLLQFARQTLPTLREHLQMARQLRDRLNAPDQVAQREDDDKRSVQGGSAQGGRVLTIRQGRPQVTVRDRQPHVSVEQAQPQITIRQAPPTVTIQQAQPEIVVHMPKPDVNVEGRKPQVSVTMPKPQLKVQDGQQQARVNVRERDSRQAEVEVQRQRPQVTFERTGEPKVVYRRAEGEPRVRYEQTDGNGQPMQNAGGRDRTQAKGAQEQAAQEQAAQEQAAQEQAGSDDRNGGSRNRPGADRQQNAAASRTDDNAQAGGRQTEAGQSAQTEKTESSNAGRPESNEAKLREIIRSRKAEDDSSEAESGQSQQAGSDDSAQSDGDDARQAKAESGQSQQSGSGTSQQTQAGVSGRSGNDSSREANTNEPKPQAEPWVARATQIANDSGGSESAETTGSAEPQTTMIKVDRLIGMTIQNERGQTLGEVEQVVTSRSGAEPFIVLAHGGFLGMFEDEVALPVQRLTLRGNRLVVGGMTEQEVEQMRDWEERVPDGRELDEEQTVEVRTGK